MNQILYNSSNNENNDIPKIKKKKMSFFKFQFIVCTILVISTVTYYIYTLYENNKKENVSKKLLNNFNIISLYSTSNIVSTTKTNDTPPFIYTSEGTDFSVIGVIEIKKIQLNYPIISTYNDELLKIAPCRFFGPMPNEIGNLCIAGHNYNSYKFFSKLKNLAKGDIITIYDLSRR